MKHVRHLLVAALTVFLAAVLAVPAFAADGDGHTITVPKDDTHTYRVFQVLTGTLSEDGSKQLGNPAWGADAKFDENSTTLVGGKTAQQFVASLSGKSETEVAALVATAVKTNTVGRGTVSKDNPLSGLATGYYVLVDETDLTAEGYLNDTKALNVVKVVNDVEVNKKWDTTSDDKEIVSDTLGADDPANTVGGDIDNVSIGDTVNFKITAKVPAKATDYDYFYFIINDTLDAGLTFNKDIKLYDGDDEIPATAYTVKIKGNDTEHGEVANLEHTFEVALVNAKAYAGKTITVKYSADLNANAQIGENPNKNTSTVTFSNNPNYDYDGSQDNDNPGFPDSTKPVPTGETPVTETETYTTGIEIQKVDENGDVLTGAEFKITGDATEIVLVSTETFAVADDGKYYGLKDGTYTTKAPVTEDHMEEAPSGATKGYVVAATDYEGDDAVTYGNVVYRPVKTGEIPTHILVEKNSDLYDGKQYNKTVTYTQTDTNTTGVTATAMVGPDGVVRFVGLGAGTYTISETKTPAGYNTLPDLEVTIAFDGGETPKWSATSGEGDGKTTYTENADGVFEIQIENEKGTTLPETGGMGTTILYIVGGCMIAAGVVMFLTKRRMASLEQ